MLLIRRRSLRARFCNPICLSEEIAYATIQHWHVPQTPLTPTSFALFYFRAPKTWHVIGPKTIFGYLGRAFYVQLSTVAAWLLLVALFNINITGNLFKIIHNSNVLSCDAFGTFCTLQCASSFLHFRKRIEKYISGQIPPAASCRFWLLY